MSDYRYNIKMGMTQEQSLDVLKAMLVDMIEFEKEKAFGLGQDSGRYAVLADLEMFGPEYVLRAYTSKA